MPYTRNSICVVNISSVHKSNDVRVFHKFALSLSDKFCSLLITCDGSSTRIDGGVKIIDLGNARCLIRLFVKFPLILLHTVKNKANVCILHDPELLLIALPLKLFNVKVIYDIHEDYPKQILNKHYLSNKLKKPISFIFDKFEKLVARNLDGITCATKTIESKFKKFHASPVTIYNYPLIAENKNNAKRDNVVSYIGNISECRGIRQMIKLSNYSDDYSLRIAGICHNKNLFEEIMYLKNRGIFIGFLNRIEISNLLFKSKVGLLLLDPTENYLDSLPIKMFEYMSHGIPIIASDFPLWRNIIESHNCGFLVDPYDIHNINKIITKLVTNDSFFKTISENCIEAAKTHYNWLTEENKLLNYCRSC